MSTERDKILIERVRKAAEDFSLALNEAAEVGLLMECVATPRGCESHGNHIVKQSNWYVQVFAQRVTRL